MIALIGGAYVFLVGGGEDNIAGLTDTTPNREGTVAETEELVIVLNQLKFLEIDTGLFTSTIFRSLEDFTPLVPEEEVGRDNPFLPIGF